MKPAFSLIGLAPVWKQSAGNKAITIGIIDGPVDTQHPDLQTTLFKQIDGYAAPGCTSVNSLACTHGTFVAGILGAARTSATPGICRSAAFLHTAHGPCLLQICAIH